MRKIRVTVGTVGYYDAKHAHKRMTAADGPFECEDTQAEHFVSAGVAEYVGGVIEADEADEQEVTGHLAKSQLEEMTIQQLQNLAGDLGVDVTGCKKKADYVVKCELCRFLSMGKHPEHDQQQTEQRKVYRFQLNEWNHFHHEFRTQLCTQHSVW